PFAGEKYARGEVAGLKHPNHGHNLLPYAVSKGINLPSRIVLDYDYSWAPTFGLMFALFIPFGIRIFDKWVIETEDRVGVNFFIHRPPAFTASASGLMHAHRTAPRLVEIQPVSWQWVQCFSDLS